MGTIYLLRHGRTKANELWLFCGRTDLPLSMTGAAEVAQKRDAGVYPAPNASRIYLTSGLLRTEQTLQTIYGNVEHRQVAGLAEMDFGDWEMCSWEELENNDEFKRWHTGNGETRCPNGESSNDMQERVLAAWRNEVAPLARDAEVLVVVHGGTIAHIMGDAFAEEGKGRFEWQPGPGLGYRLETDDEGNLVSYEAISGGDLDAPSNDEAKSDVEEDSKRVRAHKPSYKYYTNHDCKYFPCHDGADPDDFSCLFCYCPLYALGDKCGGNFTYTDRGIKNCTNCLIPHEAKGYQYVLKRFPNVAAIAAQEAGRTYVPKAGGKD